METARFTLNKSHDCPTRQSASTIAILTVLMLLWSSTSGHASLPCDCNELDPASSRWRLFLYAKHPASWKVVDGGARGELQIERGSGRFEFNAAGLAAGTAYVLVRIDEQGRSGELLGVAKAGGRGEVKFSGNWQNWQGKFWLVTAGDILDMPQRPEPGARLALKAWHPSSYLFESEVIR